MNLVTSYPVIVGAVLVALRRASKKTQIELQPVLGLNVSTVSRLERGASGLTVDQLALLARAYGVRPGDVLRHADNVCDRVVRERGVEVFATRVLAAEAVAQGRGEFHAHWLTLAAMWDLVESP